METALYKICAHISYVCIYVHLKGSDHWENLGTDSRISECILKKYYERMWPAFIRLMIRTSSGLVITGMNFRVPLKAEKFMTR
jgi:hypothetical protein